MTDPQARPVGGEPPTAIMPIVEGSVRGERYVMSLDQHGRAVYVQFEGWVVEYPLHEMLEEAFEEVWGEVPDDFSFENFGGDE